MERIAIIDLGSNTARLLLVDISDKGHFQIIDQMKEAPRLGEGMEKDGNGQLPVRQPRGAACRQGGAPEIPAVQTAAAAGAGVSGVISCSVCPFLLDWMAVLPEAWKRPRTCNILLHS